VQPTQFHSQSITPKRNDIRDDREDAKSGEAYKAAGPGKGDLQRTQRVINQKLALINQRRATKGVAEVRPNSPMSTCGKPRARSQKIDEDLDSRLENRRRPHGLGMRLSDDPTFPVTPDMSELESSSVSRVRPFSSAFFENTYTPQSGMSQNDSFEDVPSPSDTTNLDSFTNAVATPPVAESDLEPFEGDNATFAQASSQRPTLNTAAAQNASLPSPGLSPTFASAELHHNEFPGAGEEEFTAASPGTQSGDSQNIIEDGESSHGFGEVQPISMEFFDRAKPSTSVMDTSSMLRTFASMPNDMQALMMFQFLKRCSRKTLHVIANVVNPALKCDFLAQLPLELSLQILSFLDHKDLCRAAQVSKQWRNIVDSNETGWKELLDRDGFSLPVGELEKAIQQGWGWQDPFGPDGSERDLSVRRTLTFSDGDFTGFAASKVESEPLRKVRASTKRKRPAASSSSERAKRRAAGVHEFTEKAHDLLAKYPHTARYHKSEGPMTAASAAALAVPDPELGLSSLRKLHLFKSLYRRH
jgi:F-box and WD-40 domain protein CDC4